MGTPSTLSMSKMIPPNLVASPFEKLDSKLLHAVLQCLGCQQLGLCACVNSAWSKEAPLALKALKHVEWQVISDKCADKLGSCLIQHAGHVQRLCVLQPEVLIHGISAGQRRSVLLPWARLTQLQSISLCRTSIPEVPQLTAGHVGNADGTGSSSSPGHNPLLPQLQQLELQDCRMFSMRCLLLLASSSTLTSLKVSVGTTFGPPTQQYPLPQAPRVSRLLEELQQQGMLQQLAVLHLPGMLADSLDLTPSMLHLQDLELCVTVDAMTVRLPQSLTRLKLTTKMGGLPRPMVSPLQLSNLQKLHLHYCSISPTVLQGMTQLQRLVLNKCHVHPRMFINVPQLLQLTDDTETPGVLQQISCQHSLEFIGCRLHDALFAVPSAARQDLTACRVSPQLTRLVLSHSNMLWQSGDLQQMFPADRQLPQLQELEIEGSTFSQDEWCVGSQDLVNIISSCIGLHKLVLCDVVGRGADRSPLLELPQCCRDLKVGGYAFTNPVIAGVVAQLTQLTRLNISRCTDLSFVGLDSLTALTQLDSLDMCLCSNITKDDGYQKLRLRSSDAEKPVYMQLHDLCCRDMACVQSRQQRLQEASMRAQAHHAIYPHGGL